MPARPRLLRMRLAIPKHPRITLLSVHATTPPLPASRRAVAPRPRSHTYGLVSLGPVLPNTEPPRPSAPHLPLHTSLPPPLPFLHFISLPPPPAVLSPAAFLSPNSLACSSMAASAALRSSSAALASASCARLHQGTATVRVPAPSMVAAATTLPSLTTHRRTFRPRAHSATAFPNPGTRTRIPLLPPSRPP